jgi:hypothetical protein
MKTTDFRKTISSSLVRENLNKMFGLNVNLENYSREQLEDIRNKLRTKMFQQEGSAGINDLLTNETYQKDKAMLQLLNTRIKEMLGEDIKTLRDKMVELSEGKKGVRDTKHTKKASGTKAAKDYDGDGKVETPKDEVWGSRAKAAAKAGKPFSEAAKGKCCCASKGEDKCPVHGTVEEAHDVKDTGYSKRYTKKSSDKATDDGEETSSKKHSNPFDNSAALAAHAKAKKGTTVQGKAQSAKQPKDDMDESAKPSAGMSKAEKSAVVKKAKAGKDIGKPGKGFAKVEKAAKAGGARDPKAVAAAAMWKQQAKENFKRNVRMVNESLAYLIQEDEEGKAKAITAAGDIVNDYTSWMQRVGQYQTKSMIELADSIRADFGVNEAETFKQTVGPALAATLETLTAQREAISNAVAVLAGEQMPAGEPMGAEPPAVPAEPGMDMAAPDEMNPAPAGDEFAASDAAAGAGTPGREMRESRFARKLAESHSIISKLAK